MPVATDWLYMCGTNDPNSALLTANGVNVATAAGGSGGGGYLAINGYFNQDITNWGVAEVMIWNRILSNAEINAVNAYLAGTYGALDLPFACFELCCSRVAVCGRRLRQ